MVNGGLMYIFYIIQYEREEDGGRVGGVMVILWRGGLVTKFREGSVEKKSERAAYSI
jgi:hypothetical protein